MQPLIVVGGGEHGRVVIEAAQANRQWRVLGFVDPNPCEETAKRLGISNLGSDSALSSHPDAKLVLGIGCTTVNSEREKIVTKIGGSPDRWTAVVHPSAWVSPSASLAEGVVILPGAVICSGVKLARHCIVNIGASIAHDAVVGSFVHIAPQAVLGGGARIGANAYIGMGSSIRNHTEVAERTMVGMGAAVVKKFAPGATLVGVPAEPK
jgi:acetyltransferase EpsM